MSVLSRPALDVLRHRSLSRRRASSGFAPHNSGAPASCRNVTVGISLWFKGTKELITQVHFFVHRYKYRVRFLFL